MGSIDLIDCQVGRREIPKLPGGQGERNETVGKSQELRSEFISARSVDG
jgi:hypothetical protein